MLQRTTFLKVAEMLTDAVVLTDAQGKIQWTNTAFHQLCGHSRREVLNRKPGSFLQGPDTDKTVANKIGRAIRRKQAVEAEILNYHKDGRPYWVSLKVTPVTKKDGELEGYLGLAREITHLERERHEVENELAEVYQALVHVVQTK